MDALLTCLQEKDAQDMEEYAFLEDAGEDIGGGLKKSRRNMKRSMLFCLTACALLFVSVAVASRPRGTLQELMTRPDSSQADREVELQVRAQQGDASQEKEITVSVPARELTAAEAAALMDDCEKWLRETLRADGQAVIRVAGDLLLPKQWADGAVEIAWASSDPGRVTEEGKTDLVGAPDGTAVELAAVLQAGDHARQVRFRAELYPSEADLVPSLQREMEMTVSSLAEDLTETEQILPERSPYGAALSWSIPKTGLPWEIAGLCLFCCACLYFSHTDRLKKHLKTQRLALEREIPNMSLQMILLLDAGLTVDSAFQRLIDENRENGNPLYRAMTRLQARSAATNMPFVNELYVFARQSGLRDLIRFSSLALDCSGRGSELAEKLDRERQQLWSGRLNTAKAKAREAETKLCLPLMLLLLVLVTVSIAPALMEL